MTRIKNTTVKPAIVTNRLAIKPGVIDEFVEAQVNYASALMKRPTGLIGTLHSADPAPAYGFTAHAARRHGSGGSWMLVRPVVLSKLSTFTCARTFC
jgi:hypothetical protein